MSTNTPDLASIAIIGAPQTPATDSGVLTLGSLPASVAGATNTVNQFQTQTTGLSTSAIYQAVTVNNGTQVVANATSTTATAASATTTTIPSGTPQQCTTVAASEGTTKSASGLLMALITVSFGSVPFDPYFAGAQVFFTGYHGSSTPVAMVQGNNSPIVVPCDITGETVTVTVVSVGFDGSSPDFNSAPSTTAVLNGIATAPVAPSTSAVITTATGFQFGINVLTSAEAGFNQVSGYWVYVNSSNSYPGPVTGRAQFIPHSETGNGVFTFTYAASLNTTAYFWTTTVDVFGNESTSPYAAGGTTAITPIYDGGNLQLKNILTASQGTANLGFPPYGHGSQLGNNTITATFKGNPVFITFHANVYLSPGAGPSTTLSGGAFFLFKDGSLIDSNAYCVCEADLHGTNMTLNINTTTSFSYLDNPSAGSHQYQIIAAAATSDNGGLINWSAMQIIELG